ncbi:MAG: hypothetical protein J0I65_28115 [Variovorax sp.]|nr:hypothetical protein [Variovorax sp.]
MKYTTSGFAVDEIEFLQHVPVRVLVAAARGKLDLNRLAREELAQRGLNQEGVWVGASRAELAFDAASRRRTWYKWAFAVESL